MSRYRRLSAPDRHCPVCGLVLPADARADAIYWPAGCRVVALRRRRQAAQSPRPGTSAAPRPEIAVTGHVSAAGDE